jgi:hypothetical protein
MERSTKPEEKWGKKRTNAGTVAGIGEEEKSSAEHVVWRDNLFLVAPRPPRSLHRENLFGLERERCRYGFESRERAERKY